MADIDTIRKEVQAYLENADDIKVQLLHQYVQKLIAKAAYVPQPKPIRVPRVVVVKDWWNNLSEEQVFAIESALTSLDQQKGITDSQVKKQNPTWFH